MSVELKEIENLKIVPENYEDGTVCSIENIDNDCIKLNLYKIAKEEIKSYTKGANVEIFGLNRRGIVYFTSEILENNQNAVIVKYPECIKEIQRRKYSRVPFYGKLTVFFDKNIKIKEEDISAGGLKFSSSIPFMVGVEYNIKIELANGLVVNCIMQPIRVEENEQENIEKDLLYSISSKFKKIRSIDRIALMQYSLRFISEMENKA